MGRPHPPRTPIERDIVEAEASLDRVRREATRTSPSRVLRFANVLGPDVRTSHIDLFSLPAVPMILGFDPRYQFVHEDDVVHALEHAVKHDLPGRLQRRRRRRARAERGRGLLGKPYAPVLPPWGTGLAASALRRLGIEMPAGDAQPAALRARRRQPPLQGHRLRLRLHEPRGGARSSASTCACTRSCAAPASPTATSARSRSSCAGARTSQRRDEGERPPMPSAQLAEPRSSWRRTRGATASPEERGRPDAGRLAGAGARARAPRDGSAVEHYDDLEAEEVISLLGSLERDDLSLRDYERRARSRGDAAADRGGPLAPRARVHPRAIRCRWSAP